MKKGRKYIASLLVIGGLAGVSLYNSDQINVFAHGNQDSSANWRWENHDETMRSHMETMHGNSFRNREDSRPDDDVSENNTDESENAETDSWNDWHNRMWETRDDDINDSEADQSEAPESFFGEMRNHMRGLNDVNFNGMSEWMEEMHSSFNFNRGIMNENERKLNVNPNRGFMEKFNFFNIN